MASVPARARTRGAPYAWLKPAVFTGALVPLASLALRAAAGTLSADPVAYLLNQFGLLTLIFLITTLTLTPLRKLFGWTWPIRIRRTVGLFAFFYACLHFTTYVVVDQSLNLPAILQDIVKRKFIFVGFSAFLLLIPLAVTSTNGMVRRLGAVRWQRLHRLVYPAAILGAIHFLWRVKRDISQPAAYGAVLAILLGFRVFVALTARGKKQSPVASRSPQPTGDRESSP